MYQGIPGAREEDIGIVEKTDTATHNISKGQYVIWKGKLYQANTAISTGGTLSTSNLTEKSNGIGDEVKSLSDHIAKTPICEKVYVSGTTDNSGIIGVAITNKYAYAFCLTNVSKSLGDPYSVTVDNYNNTTQWMNLRIRRMSDNSAVSNTSVGFDVLIIGIWL